MNKKTSIIAVSVLVVLAVFISYILVNKGDDEISGLILSKKPISDVDQFDQVKSQPGGEVLRVYTTTWNKLKEEQTAEIKVGSDLYANVHVVESPKGMAYTAKWLSGGRVIQSETKNLTTDREGILSFTLQGSKVAKGPLTLELHDDQGLAASFDFTIN
ncbi:hypothetical protein ACFQ3W_02990 [Paenibacillus puldeungensis]|uniref:DUF4352 domain-containing protein n=1 Tax=Paenibacillus puldeungensis TaxID=696536 RepID=A0ABW3RS40_9BACL